MTPTTRARPRAPAAGETIELNLQAHSAAVTLIDTCPASAGAPLLACASTRTEVKLWDASRLAGNALLTIPGARNGRLAARGERLVAACPSEKRALVYDVASGRSAHSLEDASGGPVIRTAVWADAVWSPDGQLLLWGHALWDPRASCDSPVHRFEAFSNSDFGAGAFHPRGGVAVINSEVWDLRTFKLMRSVPALLAGAELKFAPGCGGDVAFAFLRGGREESGLAAARRSKNPLRSAFRTIDTVDWTEIATARAALLSSHAPPDIAGDPTVRTNKSPAPHPLRRASSASSRTWPSSPRTSPWPSSSGSSGTPGTTPSTRRCGSTRWGCRGHWTTTATSRRRRRRARRPGRRTTTRRCSWAATGRRAAAARRGGCCLRRRLHAL